MHKKPGVIINIKKTPSGFMVLDIETQLFNQPTKPIRVHNYSKSAL